MSHYKKVLVFSIVTIFVLLLYLLSEVICACDNLQKREIVYNSDSEVLRKIEPKENQDVGEWIK
jgi:hypothetical protein